MGVVLFPVSTKTLQRFNPGWVLATGMASGAISMLRDFGLTLGPAIVGAIALTNAASAISAKIAAVIAATMLGGREHSHAFVERELADPR